MKEKGTTETTLGDGKTHRRLFTMPGIGSKTAVGRVTDIDASLFHTCDKFVVYCGVAPADNQFGASVRPTRPQRGGNKPLRTPRILLQLAHRHQEPFRALPRRVPGAEDEVQRAEGRRPQVPQGHLLHHEGSQTAQGAGRLGEKRSRRPRRTWTSAPWRH